MPKTPLLCAMAALASLPPVYSQPELYNIQKTALYIQTAASGAVASPGFPYFFNVEGPAAATLFLPAGAGEPLGFTPGPDDYEISQYFTSKAALDAAFPNGTYQMTGTGIPTLTFLLTADNYPPAIPAVTNGTWSGGVLVIDPSTASTVAFSDFATYASGGVAGYMEFDLYDYSKTSGSQQLVTFGVISIANPFFTVQATPFAACSIPAGMLSPGDICEGQLQFATALTFDTSTLPGNGFGSIYENLLDFFIVARPSGAMPPPPVISTDVTDQTTHVGGNATFAPAVTVGGAPLSGALVALWFQNGQPLNGTFGPVFPANMSLEGTALVIGSVTAADAGVYSAKFVTDGGVVATSFATLTVNPGITPDITTQPESQTLNSGSTAVFTIGAPGSPTYQWTFSADGGSTWSNLSDGNGVSGSAGPQLVIQGASAADNGEYACIVSTSEGTTRSDAATLAVVASSNPGYLVNISARAFVGTGGNIMIGGFYVVGSTSRSVLIQVIGPGLAGEGVTGVLQHPALSIHNSAGATIYSNTGWGSSQLLLNAAAAAYANPVLQPNSADSELLLTLPPGGYTAEVAGADGGTGVALCAIYQLP